ncbi:MAG: glycoside hydrolase family 3 protein [Streptosporangiaceae bacterium]|nr:glycoside hydrolase family 3 protein [Streptosporangiaceae bacterium]
MTISRILLACVFSLALVVCGCDSGSVSSTSSPAPPPTAAARSTVTARPAESSQATALSCPDQVFSRLTQAQRVGQLFLVGIPASGLDAPDAAAIRADHLGSVTFVGNTTAGVAQIRSITRAAQSLASGGVRMFVAANQEGGEIQPLRGPGFSAIPSAVGQGALTSAELERAATTWGRELAAAGVNLDLAPVMDVVPPGTASQNAPIGALQREYGDAPGPVAAHGVAFINGMRAAGVATTAKHFPGLGRVRGNTDFTGDVVDTVTTANDPYLASFQAAIAAGVPFVMVALATYTSIDPSHLAVFSSRVIDGVLRQKMGFGGVIMSDDLGAAAAVANISPATRAIGFLEAGGDVITSQSVPVAAGMYAAVLRKAAGDAAFRGEVSGAVRRILDVKAKYGLLSC